ncbi:MAG: radical SAM protein, partial [Thermoleophilia bacterium]|nr:radical SAM protein [Thermoleophilia bacterium]
PTTSGHSDAATQVTAADREQVASGLRIGRIGFLNVFPMHWALGVAAAMTGTPAELNTAIVAGDIDVACMSSIEYPRNADDLILLPSMCIAADGAVGSIFVISGVELENVRTLHVTAASATSVVLAQLLAKPRGGAPDIVTLAGEPGEILAADPHAGVLLIGDDALRARSHGDLGTASFTDLGERWLAETGLPMVYAVWAIRREVADKSPELPALLDRMLVESVRKFSVDPDAIATAAREFGMEPTAARTYFDRLCYGFGQHERKGLIRYLRMAQEQGLLAQVPAPQFVTMHSAIDDLDTTDDFPADDALGLSAHLAVTAAGGGSAGDLDEARERIVTQYHATVGTRTALNTRPDDAVDVERKLALEADARALDVDSVLQKALTEERLSDTEGIALLQSRRLIDIGQVAHELRLRKTPDDIVTFVVDRNINYTNVCVTDCGFCAFYRRPGDTMEGYLLSNEVILDKIRETVELGGTAALMQGGHNPDLDISYYVDLFRAVKERYPTFHLHALSPPEIQHIARR